jgi:endonuclease/exonuclease/phosphatase (EEP) superfamily protein YafD
MLAGITLLIRESIIQRHRLQRLLKNKLLHSTLILVALCYAWVLFPKAPTNMTFIDQEQHQHFSICPALQVVAPRHPLSLESTFSLLNWNIYKQQKEEWAEQLKQWVMEADLITLQEAKYNKQLIEFSQQQGLSYLQNIAFLYENNAYGVNTLSRANALQACGTRYTEPWLQIPKTGLATTYSIKGSATRLLLVNLHGVNFTATSTPLIEQFSVYLRLIKKHRGPIIISGDFNTWNEARDNAITNVLLSLDFNEALFNEDKRLMVFERPLDHIYYRDLEVINSQSIETNASDHTPQLVTFTLKK